MSYKYSFTIDDCEPGIIRFIENEISKGIWDFKFNQEKSENGLNCTLQFMELEKRHEFLELMQEYGFYVEESKPEEE